MFYHRETNQHFSVNKSFVLNDIQYPSNWLTTVNESTIEALGLVPVTVVGNKKDEKYYINSESFDNGVLTITSSMRPLVDIRKEKLKEINNITDAIISSVKDDYPADEVMSWAKQEMEAKAYMQDPSSSIPLLSAIASTRGVDIDDLALKVMIKSDIFAEFIGKIFGIRQSLEDILMAIDLEAEDALDKIIAIQWPEM